MNSDLSQFTKASPEFREVNDQVRGEMVVALRGSAGTGILDYRILRERNHKVSAPTVSFGFRTSREMKIAVGSTQGSRLLLDDFSASKNGNEIRFKATVTYEFFDHFGADDEDLLADRSLHGSPGQIALWILQRERHPGCMPFVPKIVVQTVIEDTL